MIHCVFHARSVEPLVYCIDGVFAAYAVWKAFDGNVNMVPALPKEAPALVVSPGDRIYVVDTIFAQPQTEKWLAQGAEVVIIDHHKDAFGLIQGLSKRVSGTIDVNASGAVLTWQHFSEQLGDVPLLVYYVQDRDLYRRSLSQCDEFYYGVSRVLEGKPIDEAMQVIGLMLAVHDGVERLKRIGEPIKVQVEQAIADAVNSSREHMVCGYRTRMTICRTKLQKDCMWDIANALSKTYPELPFTIVQGNFGWAVHSIHCNATKVAKLMGGGGHPAASGCKAELPLWAISWSFRDKK